MKQKEESGLLDLHAIIKELPADKLKRLKESFRPKQPDEWEKNYPEQSESDDDDSLLRAPQVSPKKAKTGGVAAAATDSSTVVTGVMSPAAAQQVHRALHDPSVNELRGPIAGLLDSGAIVLKTQSKIKTPCFVFLDPTRDTATQGEASCLLVCRAAKSSDAHNASTQCKQAFEGAKITWVSAGGHPEPKKSKRIDGSMQSLSFDSPATLTKRAKNDDGVVVLTDGVSTDGTELSWKDKACIHVLTGTYAPTADQQAALDSLASQLTMASSDFTKLQKGTLGRSLKPSEVGLLEKAKTNRSACRICKEKIEKDAIRIGVHVRARKGIQIAWLHSRCPNAEVSNLQQVDEEELEAIDGYDSGTMLSCFDTNLVGMPLPDELELAQSPGCWYDDG